MEVQIHARLPFAGYSPKTAGRNASGSHYRSSFADTAADRTQVDSGQ